MTLGFRTHRCNALTAFPSMMWPFETLWGSITDFEEPDLEMVAVRVAAKHCELVGRGVGTCVSQMTCHLKRDTEDANTL